MFAADKQFITAHLQDDIRELALKLSSGHADLDVPLVLRQIAGRQAVRSKLPAWYANDEILYPEHLPLEQCSSEKTAVYKASLVGGTSFVDLTGGFGVDSAYLSRRFDRAFYVERQAGLCSLAKRNFEVLGRRNIDVIHAEAEDYLSRMNPVDCIYLDPARRDKKGNKAVRFVLS